jgi:proliferating cell nuclear antigen
MDIDSDSLGIPDHQYSAVIEMASSEFHRLIVDLTPFSDTIVIKADKNEVKFEAIGGILGGNVVTYSSAGEAGNVESDDEEMKMVSFKKATKGADISVKVSAKSPVKISFSIKWGICILLFYVYFRYLASFSKGAKLSDRVRLSLSNNVPIVVEYQIEVGAFLSPLISLFLRTQAG